MTLPERMNMGFLIQMNLTCNREYGTVANEGRPECFRKDTL